MRGDEVNIFLIEKVSMRQLSLLNHVNALKVYHIEFANICIRPFFEVDRNGTKISSDSKP